jgi:hypothetical protein
LKPFFNALGGADNITVGDLSGTDVAGTDRSAGAAAPPAT